MLNILVKKGKTKLSLALFIPERDYIVPFISSSTWYPKRKQIKSYQVHLMIADGFVLKAPFQKQMRKEIKILTK